MSPRWIRAWMPTGTNMIRAQVLPAIIAMTRATFVIYATTRSTVSQLLCHLFITMVGSALPFAKLPTRRRRFQRYIPSRTARRLEVLCRLDQPQRYHRMLQSGTAIWSLRGTRYGGEGWPTLRRYSLRPFWRWCRFLTGSE